MRYGVVRISPDLPSPSVQLHRLEAAGCDVILDDAAGLRRLMSRMAAGDEILVHRLEAFGASTGELARLLRRFFERGVTLKIVGGSQVESLAPTGVLPRALALLADYEARRPTGGGVKRGKPTEARLTQYQLKFARQMWRAGHSARAIGLLFQLSPAEMADLLRRHAAPIELEAPEVAVPAVRGAPRARP